MAQTACMSSCKYLATKLREMLLDEEVRLHKSHVCNMLNDWLVTRALNCHNWSLLVETGGGCNSNFQLSFHG